MPQGVYPLAFASESEIGILLFERYLHPEKWYLAPVFVIYTVVSLVEDWVGAGVSSSMTAAPGTPGGLHVLHAI